MSQARFHGIYIKVKSNGLETRLGIKQLHGYNSPPINNLTISFKHYPHIKVLKFVSAICPMTVLTITYVYHF